MLNFACNRFSKLTITLLLLLLPIFSHGMKMNVNIGYDGQIKNSTWNPVAVTITNDSQDEINGVIQVIDPDQKSVIAPLCSVVISLPPNSVKLYNAYFYSRIYSDKLLVRVIGNRVMQKIVRINTLGDDDYLITSIINSNDKKMSFLSNESVKFQPTYASKVNYSPYQQNPPSSGTLAIAAGAIKPELLSDRPAAYESVDMLILNDTTLASSNPKALDAIGMWVAGGGTLVFTSSANYKNFDNDFCKEMLPVNIIGAASSGNLTSIQKMAAAQAPPSAVIIINSDIKPGGSLIASSAGMPLVVSRKYGAGRVIFIAFDPASSPFNIWNGQIGFWKNLIMSSEGIDKLAISSRGAFKDSYSGYRDYSGTGGILQTISESPNVSTPSFATIGLFLLAYLLVLVPVNYIVLNKKRKLELAWVTTPIIVMIFTFGAYVIGYTMKGGNIQLSEANIIECSADSKYASLFTNAVLFSPARRAYDLDVNDPHSVSQVLSSKKAEMVPVLLGEESKITDVRASMWSSVPFESISGVKLNGILSANLKSNGSSLIGNIKNQTGIDFKDSYVVWMGKVYKTGKLLDKGSASVKMSLVNANKARNQGMYSGGPMDSFGGSIDYVLTLGSTQISQPILIATPKSSTNIFDCTDKVDKSKNYTRYAFRLTYEMGSSFNYPPESIKGNVISHSGDVSFSYDNYGITADYFNKGSSFIASYRIPMQENMSINSINVITNAMANKGLVELFTYNYDVNKWDKLNVNLANKTNGHPSVNSPYESVTIALSNAKAYISGDGEVRLKVLCIKSPNLRMSVGISATGVRK